MSPGPKKRKLLTDFFPRSTKPRTIEPYTSTPELPVPGLSLIPAFVTPSEEQDLLAFLNSPACTWRTDLSRRTMHFGGTYCLMPPRRAPPDRNSSEPARPIEPQVITAPPIPPALTFLIDRMKAQDIYGPEQTPRYCIVNHYTGSLGISAHTENFGYGQPVVGLSLQSACPMRFHELVVPDGGSVRSGKAQRARRTGRKVDVMLPGRSLVVMRDEARWKWQHEIVRTGRGRGVGWERVSLTFRVKD